MYVKPVGSVSTSGHAYMQLYVIPFGNEVIPIFSSGWDTQLSFLPWLDHCLRFVQYGRIANSNRKLFPNPLWF